jgi:hypothetical protein
MKLRTIIIDDKGKEVCRMDFPEGNHKYGERIYVTDYMDKLFEIRSKMYSDRIHNTIDKSDDEVRRMYDEIATEMKEMKENKYD